MSYTANNRRLHGNDRRESIEDDNDAGPAEGAADPEDSEEEQGDDDAQSEQVDDDGDIVMATDEARPRGGMATRKTNFDLPCKIRLFGLIEDEGHALKDPGSLAYIMSKDLDEYVDAFKRCDTQTMIELGVPIGSLLVMTEGAEAQEEASGARPKPPTQ
ncbi:hypothetical protein SGCOL_006787 [Colletotrichum sp. CLE4]